MNEVINNIFDKEITTTMDNFPSIYSKDDVVCIINKLRSEFTELDFTQSMLTELKFQEFSSSVRYRLETFIYQGDLVDNDSAEFRLDYDNRIQLDNISIDVDSITEELDDILLESFQRHFGDLICKDKE